MTALIITETCFGNTVEVADAIAEGLLGASAMDVRAVLAGEAPRALPEDVELLILAAPTHDYSLPRPRTRLKAHGRGGSAAGDGGLREWIAGAEPVPALPVVTVDTALQAGFMPSTAAKTAARLLRKAGFHAARRGATFFVADMRGPLEDGEALRARAWASTLGAGLRAARQTEPI
jgi:hypothetical protein